MNDEVLERVGHMCPQLRTLDISGCHQVTDNGLLCMLQAGGPPLTQLQVNHSPALTDHALALVTQRCPQLHTLGVAYCPRLTEQSLLELSKNCPALQWLDVSGCSSWSESALALFSTLPHLQHLGMQDMSHWSSEALLHLAHCGQLVSLRAGDCTALNDDVLHALALACPRMMAVDLSHGLQLTQEGVQRALDLWPRLRVLVMRRAGSGQWERRGLVHSQVEVVDVSWSGGWQDEGLIALANGCPRLRRVELAWCDALTEASLRVLVAVCPHLEVLNVRCCSQFSSSFLSLLHAQGYQVYR